MIRTLGRLLLGQAVERAVAQDQVDRVDADHGTVAVERKDGSRSSFAVTARLDTPVDINYYRNGGILQTVLRKMLKG